jgi:cellulose synthase/poly-beta-1,6-N-acetylglucosamine synthase-like glycosyltransferase
MKLSVILPCFNGADTIGVQLEALTRQYWDDWEVVVVNNGSTDHSMEIVRAFRTRLPRLRIVEAHEPGTRRLGVTHSYAVGFAAAEGDAFVLCEADDEVGEGWLQALGYALLRHEFVAAALEYERLNLPSVVPTGHCQQTAENGLSSSSPPLYLPFASGCSLGLRRSVYQVLGDPDPNCAATWDQDYCYRAQLAGIALEFVPAAVVHYRLRTTLRGAYKQGKNWAIASAACAHKYQPDSDEQLARSALELCKHVLKAGIVIASGKTTPNSWVWSLGWWGGVMQGGLGRWMKDKGEVLLQVERAPAEPPIAPLRRPNMQRLVQDPPQQFDEAS